MGHRLISLVFLEKDLRLPLISLDFRRRGGYYQTKFNMVGMSGLEPETGRV